MQVLEVLALIILFLGIAIDCFSEADITCPCGKKFSSTFTGACILFDIHYVKEHWILRR